LMLQFFSISDFRRNDEVDISLKWSKLQV